MINTTESSSSLPESRSSNSEIYVVIAELRRLLVIPPTERHSDWQIAASAAVSAISSDFAKQDNSDIALVDITLIALAAQKGSKDAKKRALRPTRWISTAPPSISEIFHEIDEARSAVRVLQPLRADWIEKYVCREIAKNKWPALTASLLDWLLKVTPSVESFLQLLNSVIGDLDSVKEEWITSVIENSTKLLVKSPLSAGAAMMSEVTELVARLDSHALGSPSISNSKTGQKTRGALLAMISQVASVEPSVLVQGAVVAAISSLCQSSGAKKELVPQDLELLCRRTISLLSVLIPTADQTHLAHYRAIWASYRKKIPKADQLLKNSARANPILSLLEPSPNDQEVKQGLGLTAGLEGVLCELIVNWDEYSVLHTSDPAVQQLEARIEEISRQLEVGRFGEVGQQVAFDPVRHYLPDKLSSLPSKVMIIKPGIAVRRSDGTSRVLLMAAVKPLNAS